MKCSTIILVLVVLFVLTYNPATGSLEKYLAPVMGSTSNFPPTAIQAIKEEEPENRHFEEVQFGN